MKAPLPTPERDPDMAARLPPWIASMRAQSLEEASFLSGAALSHLHLVLMREGVPLALLRDRLALRAAEACMTFSGRPERAAELRDALHLLRAGDLPGPAGEIALGWRRATERPVSLAALHRAIPEFGTATIGAWIDAGQQGAGPAPVARAAKVLETVLADAPRAEAAALILAEAALAQALGWDHLVPLLSLGLRRADLRQEGEALRLACHHAIRTGAVEVARQASDLARGAARLRDVAPKLRAKGAHAALAVFLARDAVAPAALPLPDRAARRFCDRLVELRAIRELTGRDMFRLYGVEG